MPQISVIMPVYNTSQYLRRSIESVLNQTYKDFELICINDGSTDNSLEILQEYATHDPRIKIINQENSGAGYSRNKGIEKASGTYLSFIDADDWIDIKFLENALYTAKHYKADIVETTKSYNVYSNNNKKLFNKRKAVGFIANGKCFRRDVIWDKLFKTSFIKENKISFPNGLCHNDAFFLLQSLYYNAIIVQNTDAIYWHNKANETSIRFKPSDAKLLSQLDMFILEIEFLNSHFFLYKDYKHNYKKLFRTAKRKRKYIKSDDNLKIYDKKLNEICRLNKYPYSNIQIFFKRIFSSRFREEIYNTKALPENYPNILKKWYQKKLKRTLNLDNPQTLNEKIQWMKLYDSTPLKTQLADKYLVREFVKEIIGEEYLIPLLGVWDNFDDIDFNTLPNQFVLKCNHGSGMNLIVTDKSKLNIKKAKKKFDNWMKENFGFAKGLQLHYNYIPHKIIAEELITPIEDYKFYCYNGMCKHILHKTETNFKTEYCNFDRKLNCLPLSPQSTVKDIKIPNEYNKMLLLAEKLSKKFNFVRVDLLTSNNQIYFSELTFTPSSGINTYTTSWDKKLGDFLTINFKDIK